MSADYWKLYVSLLVEFWEGGFGVLWSGGWISDVIVCSRGGLSFYVHIWLDEMLLPVPESEFNKLGILNMGGTTGERYASNLLVGWYMVFYKVLEIFALW